MSQTEAWTIGRLLTWTADFLKQHGSETPRLDAELLLAHAKGCPRIALYTAFTEPAEESTRTTFRELVRRRADGTPVAHLLGRREFYSLSFRVSPDVLIPRPETEFVVVALLDRAKEAGARLANAKETNVADDSAPDASEPNVSDGDAASNAAASNHAAQAPRAADAMTSIAIADVGTGSGVLAVCAAKYLPAARITAIDVSPAALRIAEANAADHRVADRIEFIESDLFARIPADRPFDFVVSNPPYVTTSELASLAREVRDHEPHLALDGGERGVAVIDRLVPQAAERLRPGGWLIMEISPMIETTVRTIVERDSRLALAATIKDLAGHARVIQARRLA